jgi:hypothetical protein
VIHSRTKKLRSNNKRGLGPSVPAFILASLSVTLCLVGAFYVEHSTGSYLSIEKIEIQNIYSSIHEGNWTIAIKLKNTGTVTSTLIGVYLNNIEVDQYNVTGIVRDSWSTDISHTEKIASGETVIKHIYVDPDKTGTSLSSGTAINIKIHSAKGGDYTRLIELV